MPLCRNIGFLVGNGQKEGGILRRLNSEKVIIMSIYTPEMVEKMRESAPLNLEKAREIANDLGVSYRSVIAKAKTEGIEYTKAAPAAKKPKGQNKSDTVQQIARCLNASEEEISSLDKANASALATLLDAIVHLSPEVSEA